VASPSEMGWLASKVSRYLSIHVYASTIDCRLTRHYDNQLQ